MIFNRPLNFFFFKHRHLHFCSASSVVPLFAAGPAIQVSALQSSITEDSFELQWEELDFVSQGLLDIYEVWTATHSRTVNEIVSHDTYRFFLRSGMISGLSPGTVYNVTVRGVYLNDIVGLNNSILVTTPENCEYMGSSVALSNMETRLLYWYLRRQFRFSEEVGQVSIDPFQALGMRRVHLPC